MRPALPHAGSPVQATPVTVPVFTDRSLVEGGARLYPRGIATATPRHFTVASGSAVHTADPKFPTPPGAGAHRTQPSARFQLVVP